MLALAIISTVILSLLILAFFGTLIVDGEGIVLGFVLMNLLAFVIVAIWFLYAR